MRQAQTPDYPLTVFYAFKQSESDEDEDDEAVRSCLDRLGDDAEGLCQFGVSSDRHLADAELS